MHATVPGTRGAGRAGCRRWAVVAGCWRRHRHLPARPRVAVGAVTASFPQPGSQPGAPYRRLTRRPDHVLNEEPMPPRPRRPDPGRRDEARDPPAPVEAWPSPRPLSLCFAAACSSGSAGSDAPPRPQSGYGPPGRREKDRVRPPPPPASPRLMPSRSSTTAAAAYAADFDDEDLDVTETATPTATITLAGRLGHRRGERGHRGRQPGDHHRRRHLPPQRHPGRRAGGRGRRERRRTCASILDGVDITCSPAPPCTCARPTG